MTTHIRVPRSSPPSLSPPRKPAPIHSHGRKHRQYGDDYDDDGDSSDLSSVSDFEDGADDFDEWWSAAEGGDSLSADAGMRSFQKFLKEQFPAKDGGAQYRHRSLPVKKGKLQASARTPDKEGEKDHSGIVEERSGSRDEAGKVDFCFWSMNGCTCQCGKCN